jgi:hypothetical protein
MTPWSPRLRIVRRYRPIIGDGAAAQLLIIVFFRAP